MPETESGKITYCFLCPFEAEDSSEFDRHLEEPRHCYNYILYRFQQSRKCKAKNESGVVVNVRCDGRDLIPTADGTVKTIVKPERKEVVYTFQVKNSGGRRNQSVMLKRLMLLHPYEAFQITDPLNISDNFNCMARLHPGSSYKVTVIFTNSGATAGTYGVPVCFTFAHSEESRKEFDIIRMMVVNVTATDHGSEQAETQSSPFTGEAWSEMDFTIYGSMPDGRRIKRLLEYTIPSHFKILFKNNFEPWADIDEDLVELLFTLFPLFSREVNLTKDVYAEYFHMLLYLDEYTATVKLQQYNMANVPLTIINEYRLQLEVPGLAEKRPSVLKGDLIYVRVNLGENEVERIQYEGVIADVREKCVLIGGFDKELMERIEEDPSLLFDIHFSLNRFSFFVMHRAVDILVQEDLFDIVFPPDPEFPPLPVGNIKFINPLIRGNPEQREAVMNILKGTSRPAPYIVFGPPGTGKTVTVVEAILQVKKQIQGSYILVCAPSNAACDLLAQKLVPHCKTEELLRLHSSSREWDTVPADLHAYSNRAENSYYFPSQNELNKYRIIVCTLISSGRLLPKINREDDFYDYNHFTHIFIDECGQALEPAALVPIAGILGRAHKKLPGGQVILAGDPQQLGPVCESKNAEKFGLGVSLMERLMTNWHLYMRSENGMYDKRVITKLRRNFRSHELILRLPNKLFYDNELISECPASVTNDRVKNLKNNREYDHAVVFHGVLGHERREGKSPSYFNLYEIETVMVYVSTLLRGGPSREPLEQKEIGIIAPYIRQAYKLKGKLKEKGWDDIEVGTTETFQGREKRVILISTVRSNRNLLDYDARFRLGFVANPKMAEVCSNKTWHHAIRLEKLQNSSTRRIFRYSPGQATHPTSTPLRTCGQFAKEECKKWIVLQRRR
ncbi:putative helicase mov-10-B.1 isoform X2 [Periplaneta americana]|uniref:putative helicase mov-10-B.1 isoform X2 n=1 Tax=Periplaneta americana TaxID=6978 RepID=UPI0037E7D1A9